MIITRTPFRVTLGGGGTDLPSYYSKYGGFIFSFALDKYMFIYLNRSIVDDLIRIKYSKSETVSNLKDVEHEIARSCLELADIDKGIEITSMADIPAGSGLGSSSTYTVGVLNALHTMQRDYISLHDLAEEACHIEIDKLKKPMGKQDQYLATFGGFTVLEIARDGTVVVEKAKINYNTIESLKSNLLIFYTGKQRLNKDILAEQDSSTKKSKSQVIDSLHYIKESGYKILEIVESGKISDLGKMFDEHWRFKKKLAKGVSSPEFDRIYGLAKDNGAIGGKISGAGGGGFFTFYCEDNHEQLRAVMKKEGMLELKYNFDYEGTKVLANFRNYNPLFG